MKENSTDNKFIDALFDILYFGNGFSDMLALAETYIQAPIFFYDLNYNLIASSPKGHEHTGHLHKTRNHSYLNETETGRMEKYQVLKDLNRHRDSFMAEDKDDPEIRWLLCAVRVKESFVGYIISPITGNGRQDHQDIFTQLSRALSVEFQKNDAFTYKTGIKYAYFMNNLLNGEFETDEETHTRLRVLGRKIGVFYHIICISGQETLGNNEFHRSIEEQARLCFSDCISVIHDGNLVLFVNAYQSAYESISFFNDLERFLKTHKLMAGISHEYTSAAKTKGSYQCARNALETGIAMHIPEQLFFTKDLMFYQLLGKNDIETLRQLISPLFQKMEEYDQKNHSPFISTLKTYFRCGRNASLAAQIAGLHRTTFFYRIKAMEDRFNIDLSDEHTLFSLEISLKIREYLLAISGIT